MLTPTIALSTETGKLPVMHLKRFWNKAILTREGKLNGDAFIGEWATDTTLLAALGLGLEQTMQYVFHAAPTFEQFENWILEVTGGTDAGKIARFNQLISGDGEGSQCRDNDLLTKEDWDFFNKNGYIVIRNAVTPEHCDLAIEAICNFLEIDRYDPLTWYKPHPERKGIMVQLFNHPALEQNRHTYKIKKAFEELLNRTDLWVNTDRAGFNPPQTESHPFQGPRLHWDVSLQLPIPFGLQGILYLADTAENQGAFTLVPGYQNKIDNWINSLPANANPRTENLYALGPKSIAANAGDFIMWHHALPHGSSPNTATVPRFVQYINYLPLEPVENGVWK